MKYKIQTAWVYITTERIATSKSIT